MLKYLKKQWYWCLLAPVCMLGEIAMDLIQPDFMARIVDNGVLAQNMEVIITLGIQMILLVLFGGLCGVLCGVFANLGAQRFGNDLRKDLFRKIMALSFQQTDQISTGSLVTRLTNDVTQVQNMVMMSVRGLVRSGSMFLGGIYMLYRQSPQFAGVVGISLPLVVVLVVFFMKKASPMFSVVQKSLDGVNNVMQEDVAGARVVKAYVKEEYEMNRFDKANDLLCRVNLKVQSLLAFMSPCMNVILNICVVAIIYLGGLTVKNDGGITTGEIMAAITYVALILNSIMFLANIFQTFTRAQASVSRINEVLNQDEVLTEGSYDGEASYDGAVSDDGEASDASGAYKAKNGADKTGSVELKHVYFAYPGDESRAVLEDISIKINPGETLAVLGTTGCGKTTLVNLISRFYDAVSGEVLVDGVNVKEYTKKALRKKIGIVLQKAELYSRSVEANIRFGRADADEWDIKKAAMIAQADDFICQMDNGYYTLVSEGGHSLSGGQKQRISLARAVLKHPEILLLDDATSALDLKTEANLYEALRRECPDMTKIIIAQRIASVKGADRIIVLENGHIAASGSHEELMENSEIYQDIYNSQLKKGGELHE